MNPQRRQAMVRTAALASLLTPWGAPLLAQATQPGTRPAASKAVRLGETLRIFIPANPGGGWDQTGRALGEALQASGAVAGQTVGHFHLHVLPRHAGDGVDLAWPRKEPGPAALADYAERLRAALTREEAQP